MNELEYLEKLTGEKWVGLRFSREALPKTQAFAMLCEAVDSSFKGNIALECAELSCHGALLSLGLESGDDRMARRMSERAALTESNAKRIISSTPRLTEQIVSIEIGKICDPDVYVSCLTPESAMILLRRWQQYKGERLQASLSAFTALCSTVVTAFVENELSFSFGCPDSRAYGGITNDRMIAAIPFSLAANLADECGRSGGE